MAATSSSCPSAQDHKRLLEGDAGPNTGGMGRTVPVAGHDARPCWSASWREVLRRCSRSCAARGRPFTGVLYAGLMIDSRGPPKVVEFNCRLGDPETQVVLPWWQADSPIRSGRWLEGGRDADRAARRIAR